MYKMIVLLDVAAEGFRMKLGEVNLSGWPVQLDFMIFGTPARAITANGAFHTSLGQRPGNAPGSKATNNARAEGPHHQSITRNPRFIPLPIDRAVGACTWRVRPREWPEAGIDRAFGPQLQIPLRLAGCLFYYCKGADMVELADTLL